ncbi:hypothetical protein BCR44DRAFT_313964 [Catenaria anguillulae PL171]|uniref:RNA polymerase II subunit B1 CTD phosphatase RPAP2 homolog n=1 Tax=Catenaria anguillulae PL171 TaxID=765915 RepID=A0A1Y2HE80_9FUNG|nr:hypothetical protein BCR44DRAFT_313964 [Catenaria anguillulae PL171]
MCSHTMSPHSSTLHLPGRSSRLAGGPGGPSSSLLNPKIQRQRRPTAPLAESASTTPTTPTPGQKRQAAVRSTFALKRSTDKRIAAAQATLCSHSPMDPNDLRAAAAILQPAHWDEVALERNLADLCAYPLCRQSSLSPSVTSIVLGPNGHQSHDTPAALSKLQPWTPVTASQLALLPATAELASFCSRKCWLKSSFIRLQLSHDPLYLRPANAKPVSILLAEDEDAHHLALPEQVSASSSLVSYIDDMLAQAAASFSSAKTSSSVPVTENQPDPTAIIPFERVDSYGIDGHSTKADNGARRMVASRTRSRAAATVRCAAPFTIVTAAFSGVTPKACRLISSPVQPPNGAHVAKPRPNPGDHADDMVSFNLENKLQRELFLQRFEAIFRAHLVLFPPLPC